jgi:hypothetical protein
LPVQCGTPLHATDLVVFRKLGRSHYFPLFENSLGRSLKKLAPPAQNETSSGGPIPTEQSLASNLPANVKRFTREGRRHLGLGNYGAFFHKHKAAKHPSGPVPSFRLRRLS